MKTPWRIFLLLLVSLVIFLGVFYTPFVVNNILMPLALVFWLFLRTFFLHIDQKNYWVLLIFVGMILALYHLMRQTLLKTEAEEQVEAPPPNSIADEINHWLIEISNSEISERERRAARWELIDLMVSLYTPRHRETTPAETLEALQQRQIPLPEPIYQFLFAELINETKLPPLRRALHFIQHAPRQWVRKWTGREKAEFYQSIEDILSFIENSLEMTHGDKNIDPNTH
jgi:hypothetical protein